MNSATITTLQNRILRHQYQQQFHDAAETDLVLAGTTNVVDALAVEDGTDDNDGVLLISREIKCTIH